MAQESGNKENGVKKYKKGERFLKWFVYILILLNAVAAGLMTSESVMAQYGTFLEWFCVVSLFVFAVEMAIRIYWYGKGFFYGEEDSGWNCFDFIVTVVSFLSVFPVFQNLRLLREIRLLRITVTGQFKVILEALARSIKNIMWTVLLLMLVMYIYAVIGVQTFRDVSPEYFGALSDSMLTMFQIMTLEGWNVVAHSVIMSMPLSWIFFVSYILVATYILINLIIGIVVDSISKERGKIIKDQEKDSTDRHDAKLEKFEKEIQRLSAQITELTNTIKRNDKK